MGLFFTLQSCEDYLDLKPASNLVIPETLDDMQQLLDNGNIFTPYPELLELQADDFYFESEYWNSMIDQVNKNAYVWAKDLFGTIDSHSAWTQPYSQIFYANAVLDGLKDIPRNGSNAPKYDQIKGSALFLKAEAVYTLAQLFAKVYDHRTAETDLGIPIPMSSDVNEKIYRPSVQYTFDFIINSLTDAQELLETTVDFSRPSKAAAHALLARVYLYMGDYENGLSQSNRSLQLFSDLVNLNSNSIREAKTTLLLRIISPATAIRNLQASTMIDTSLIEQYTEGDRRLTAFYIKNPQGKWMKQRFNDLVNLCFAGFDADELFLIRAECYARLGHADAALEDLNHLLYHRFTVNSYRPYESANAEAVLGWVLAERRKELIFRGLRWSDLKRFAREDSDLLLQRKLGDNIYTLPANDPRWVLPIPLAEINITGLPQNER